MDGVRIAIYPLDAVLDKRPLILVHGVVRRREPTLRFIPGAHGLPERAGPDQSAIRVASRVERA